MNDSTHTQPIANNSVAQSEYEAAMAAIHDTFERGLEDNDQENAVLSQLLRDSQTSLIQNMQRMISTVPDSDYQDWVDLFHYIPEYNDDDDEASLETESVEESDDEEIIEEDLLDTKALVEAQELREKVRNLSRRVQSVREAVLEQAQQSNRMELPAEEDTTLETSDMERKAVETSSTSTEPLRDSLANLSHMLKDSQWSRLPQQLESLQQTIEVIQKEHNPDRPMSQTEAAIVSRTNSSTEEDDDICSQRNQLLEFTSGPSEGDLSATDRLAQFFHQFD